jgi:Carboxypeptidase regulatory-like domain
LKSINDIGMKVFKSSAATIIVLLLAYAAFAQDKSTGAIKGKVRVEKGSPGGVTVILRQGEREVSRVSTDRKGDFLISRIAPGTYGLTFRKPGLAVGSIEGLEVKSGKTRSLGDHLVLSIDEGSIAFIRGSVFNENGRSVPNVRVELARIVSENQVEALDARVTGETGEFVFRVPPDVAKYRLTLKAEGAEPDSKDVEVDGAAVFRVALKYKPNPK